MFDQMVRVAAGWDWVTPMATFVQNLPNVGAFLHRKIQYDAWFMAPELEAMLKQAPTNPWPALMPDVTDWKQPFYPGNAGGPPRSDRRLDSPVRLMQKGERVTNGGVNTGARMDIQQRRAGQRRNKELGISEDINPCRTLVL